MNKREKEFYQYAFNAEEDVLHELAKQYKVALDDINEKIMILQSNELTQSKIYQLQYQQALKGQIEGILEKLHSDEFSTIQKFLEDSYTNGFVGTMYSIHGQGIPLMMPIDQKAAVKAIMTDSKISGSLYNALGVDTSGLKKAIRQEITRGIASNMSNAEIARNISNVTKAPLARAKTIVRTENHRIQQSAAYDAQKASKASGADVVKQWDSTLDGRTRPTHRQLDGQIQEIDKPFKMGGMEAMFPGDFGDPAEDCNCRCVSLTRAKWALDDDELQTLKDRAEFFGLDKTKNIEEFQTKYLKANEKIKSYESNPYVINEGDLPPAIYEFRDYEDFRSAVDEWRSTHEGSPYDYYVQNSNWATSDLSDAQIERLKRFDATIAKLQSEYQLPSPYSEKLYIGSYDNMGIYLNDIQRTRMDSALAQAQFWFNPDEHSAVIGFNPIGAKGTLLDDLLIREETIAKGERLLSVMENSPEGIAIHEWGHGYTDFITREMVYGNPAAEEYWKWYKTLTKDAIGDGISTYAMTNRGEFEAECFAELLTGSPRPIAVKFSTFLERCVEDAQKRVEKYGVDAVVSGEAGKIDLALNYAIKHDTSSIKTLVLPKDEYAHIMSEIATNLTESQKQQSVVTKAIGSYVYTFENNGFGNYRIIGKTEIDSDVVDWWGD